MSATSSCRGRRPAPALASQVACAGADAGMQRKQQLAGRTIGAMDDETPAEPVGLSADLVAVAVHTRGVIGAPGFGAARRDAAAAFRLDELDAAPIRECLLGRIDDLHHVAMGAAAGELRDRAAHVADRAPQVGEQHDFGERRGRKIRRQARRSL